jgi:hypothetical protein
MKDERPWTPGPWNIYDTPFSEANTKLSLKAPEMAELLIDYCRIGNAKIDINIAIEELDEVYQKARELLKEIGYDSGQT